MAITKHGGWYILVRENMVKMEPQERFDPDVSIFDFVAFFVRMQSESVTS